MHDDRLRMPGFLRHRKAGHRRDIRKLHLYVPPRLCGLFRPLRLRLRLRLDVLRLRLGRLRRGQRRTGGQKQARAQKQKKK